MTRQLLHKNKILSQINSEDQAEIETLRWANFSDIVSYSQFGIQIRKR